MFTSKIGEIIQFDLRIFLQIGWFNHQPVSKSKEILLPLPKKNNIHRIPRVRDAINGLLEGNFGVPKKAVGPILRC